MTKKQLREEFEKFLAMHDEETRFASVSFERIAYEDEDLVDVSYCMLG